MPRDEYRREAMRQRYGGSDAFERQKEAEGKTDRAAAWLAAQEAAGIRHVETPKARKRRRRRRKK